MAKIKQVTIDSTTYDLDAKYFDGHDSTYWENLIDAHTSVKGPYVNSLNPAVPDPTDPPTELYDDAGNAIPALNHYGSIYLFNHTSGAPYNEYIAVEDTTQQISYWKFIGTSETDLSDYVKKGTYTTGGPSANQTSGPSTNASNTPVYDLQSDDTITATLPVLTTEGIDSVSVFNLSPTVTDGGNHYHGITTTGKTVVNTTPSWSANVNDEVLSFSFSSGNTTTIQEVSQEMSGVGYVTDYGGSHNHKLQTNSGAMSVAQTVVTTISRSTIYYVGTVPASSAVIPNVASLSMTIPTHTHNMANHTHSMGNHTHNVVLGTPSA